MRLLIIPAIIAVVFGCQKQRDEIEKFVFDNKQISTQELHKYDFDTNGRIKTDYTTTFMYMAGVRIDSTNYVKRYEYNEKGQVIRIFDTLDSTWQTKFYNRNDSLVADYTINNHGDTVRMTTLSYSNNKSHKRIRRILSPKFWGDFENLTKETLRNYDTLLFITDFIYEGDRHIKSVSFDKHGTVTDEVEIIYDNEEKTKSITYAFLGENKFVRETSFYTKNYTNEPDMLTIGNQGDTTAYIKTIFQDGKKIIASYHGKHRMQSFAYYDKAGRMIGDVILDIKEDVRMVYSYTYDSKGYVIQQSNYRERINKEP